MSKIGIPKVVVHTFTTLVNSIPNMAQLRQAGKTAYKIAYMPWNGICKNMHYDLRSGSANFFWKYPLICAACAYPVGFYYHESKNILIIFELCHNNPVLNDRLQVILHHSIRCMDLKCCVHAIPFSLPKRATS